MNIRTRIEGYKPRESLEFDPKEVLDKSPRELADYLVELEEDGKLEDFLDKALENESLRAQLSYWEKWLSKDCQRLVEQTIEQKKKIYDGVEGEDSKESLPLGLEKKFEEKELREIMARIKAVQLTYGCSKGCAFCGLDAIRGAREHIPYTQLANLMSKYGKEMGGMGQTLLYWASEPSDYASKEGLEDRTYEDVDQLAKEYLRYSPHLTTREFQSEDWLDFVGDKDYGYRVSAFGLSERRLEELKDKLGITSSYSGELVGANTKHLKGVGVSYSETSEMKASQQIGIACKNGFILTPRGLYNATIVPLSQDFPQGQIIEPFERIGSDEIKAGDSIKKILRESIILYGKSHSDYRGREKKAEPIQLIVQNKSGKFVVKLNKNIDVYEVDKIDEEDELINTTDVIKKAIEAKDNRGVRLNSEKSKKLGREAVINAIEMHDWKNKKPKKFDMWQGEDMISVEWWDRLPIGDDDKMTVIINLTFNYKTNEVDYSQIQVL